MMLGTMQHVGTSKTLTLRRVSFLG